MSLYIKRGFTILEILVVIGLIGILVAMSSVGYVNYSQKSRDSRRKIDLQQLRSALELYRSNSAEGVYPSVSQYGSGTTSVLITAGLLQSIPVDPRGNAYVYAPLPVNCNNTSTYCISYTIGTTLEVNNQQYTVTPNSVN
ncbi:prepilin-type N-terminal cleavage/methylation domain-containing protein [Candidatus Woesebacteria bacterium]|nr:prepilin-type N-terminal cleavage/methylation domain-containing protein [Candidatus Woesebacteria bacterium]